MSVEVGRMIQAGLKSILEKATRLMQYGNSCFQMHQTLPQDSVASKGNSIKLPYKVAHTTRDLLR